MGLEKGMVVADLGVGAGFYVLTAARMVGEQGVVFGVDVQKELVSTVKRTADREGLNNVEAIWGDIEKVGGTKIKDESVDAIIVSNVLFQIENRQGFIDEIWRILKKGGKVLVVDWLDSFGGLGPKTVDVVRQETAESLFGGKGFQIVKNIDAGDHHYGFVAQK